MQPLSGNQRPDLRTSLMNMSFVLQASFCFEKVLRRSFPEVWFGKLWFCAFLAVAVSWVAVGTSALATRLRTRVELHLRVLSVSMFYGSVFYVDFFLQVFPVRASYFSFRVLFFSCAVSEVSLGSVQMWGRRVCGHC